MGENNNLRIAKNTTFLYIRMIFVLLVSLYTTRVVLNVLGVEDYGIYNVVGGFVTLFSFFNSTLSQSVQRFYNFEKGKGNDGNETLVFNTAVVIHVGIALLLLLLLETVGLWYVNNVLVIPNERLYAANFVYQCSVSSLILVVLQIPFSAAVISYEKMNYYALIGVIDVLGRLLIVVVIQFINNDRLIYYGLLLMLISVINFFLYYTYSKIKFKKLRLMRTFKKEYFNKMLSFAGWNTIDMFAYTIKSQGVSLVLNAFYGPVVNAARGIANQVNNAIQGFSSNVIIAFRPQLVESYAQNDYTRVTGMLHVMSKISYSLFFLLSVPVVFENYFILDLWLNGNVPDYTIPFTILCLADMLICSLNAPLSYVTQAVGDIKWYNIIRGIIISSIVPFSWIALKLGLSPTSVYWISLIIVIINQPVSMILLKRVFKYSYINYCKEVIFPCLIFSIILISVVAVPHYFLPSGLIRFLIVGFVDVIFAAALFFLIILNKIERESIIKFIAYKFHKN